MNHDCIPGLPPTAATDALHLWPGFNADPTRMSGTITDVNVTGSDPTLQVRGPDGRNWTVELACRARNASLGLTRTSLLPGQPVNVTGHRSNRFEELRIKAVTLETDGRAFVLFPDPALA